MQLLFKQGAKPSIQSTKAVSAQNLKIALHELPEITDFMAHDDLVSFVTAIKPLGLELKDPWARRFAAKTTMPLSVLKNLQINYEVRTVFDDRAKYQPVNFKALCLNFEGALMRGPAVVSEKFTIKGRWSSPIWPDGPVNLDILKVVSFGGRELELLRDATIEMSKLSPKLGRSATEMVDKMLRLQGEWEEIYRLVPADFCPVSESSQGKYFSNLFSYAVSPMDVDMLHLVRSECRDVARRYEAQVLGFKNLIAQFGSNGTV